MSTWDAQDHYYSGQGVVLTAERDALGNPQGYEALGNVSALGISIATQVLEHKESHTGQRGTDLRMTTETTCTLQMTVENFIAKNLSNALRGTVQEAAAGNVVEEAIRAFPGKVTALSRIRISNLVLKQGATELTPYVDSVTPYDYQLNADAGSVKFNDGSVLAAPNLGSAVVTAITQGASTVLTVANKAAVGDDVTLTGFTGVDSALLNGKTVKITNATATQITVAIVTTDKTITTGAQSKAAFKNIEISAAYNYAAQKRVDALTTGTKELALRFEGLNTAEGNNPVVVEVWRFSTDPLQELALIGDTVGQFVLEGSVLLDGTKEEGSKYFRATLLN